MRFHVDRVAKNLWIDTRWRVERLLNQSFNPEAAAFYDRMLVDGYEPEDLIKVAPKQRLIYVVVSKAGSTSIREILAEVIGTRSLSLKPNHHRKFADPRGPRRVGISTFYQLATEPNVLRFTFVRNPYDRLVSCWADKFRDKPLVPGDPFVDKYLASEHFAEVGLPPNSHRTLSFADFATFAIATNARRVDFHWQLQTDIINMPGLSLNFVGKVESFAQDISRVLEYVGASMEIRAKVSVPQNSSRRNHWAEYYTPELAERVYRSYEPDFDRFGYSRALTA